MLKARSLLALAAICLCVTAALAASSTSSAPATPSEHAPHEKITNGQAVVLGIVEGLTEYLPVSSTGHLILASHAMRLTHFTDQSGPLGPKLVKTPALDAFEIVIQLGAILAVVGLYRKNVAAMGQGLVGRNPQGLQLLAMLMLAFLPSAIVGLALNKPIKEYLFGSLSVSLALAVGGVAMILVEYFCWIRKRNTPRISSLGGIGTRHALIIGLAQCLALWPGTSRSMVTILAALIVGLDMVTAAEFSFLLALPTLGAATLYEGIRNHNALFAVAGLDGLIIGLVVSCIVAALAVKGLVRWLTHHGLMPFGVYRILLAAAVYAYFLARH
ncbi:MAG: undecaprenyl-diphosphate phosphatase [Phycisphaerae bacterium]|jgi:undecaprenyl-diphosphatase